jgi:tetratricopeptide (TPR) repeat protein
MGKCGTPDEIRRVRMSLVALDPQDANGFMQAARALGEHKQYDRALAFCRQAADLAPNAPYPYAEALVYAKEARDGKGMQWAVGNLLSQDWPADGKSLHLKAQRTAEELATLLQNENRAAEAKQIREALQRLRQRDLVINLTWQAGTSGTADLEMLVKEPGGTVCSSEQRQSPGGGTWHGDLLSKAPHAAYTAAQAFSGEYEITVRRVWGEPLWGKARLEIIQHLGTPNEVRRIETVSLARGTATFKLKLADGRRTEAATIVPPAALQRPDPKQQEVRERRVIEKLREAVDPYYTGSSGSMTGVAGTNAFAQAIAPRPRFEVPQTLGREAGGPLTPRKDSEQVVYQTGVSPLGGSGNVMATASVSPDRRYIRLSMAPVFRLGGSASPSSITLPGIPGAGAP